MVEHADRSGWRDWLVQRISAVLIGVYSIFLIFYTALVSPTNDQWHQLFRHLSMKMFTLIVLVSILWHSWIGLWTVLTDYIKNKPLRLALETLVFLLLIAYFAWACEILWVAT